MHTQPDHPTATVRRSGEIREARLAAPRGVLWGLFFAVGGFWLPVAALIVRAAQHR